MPARYSHLVDSSWNRVGSIVGLKVSSSKSLDHLYSRSIHFIISSDDEERKIETVGTTLTNSEYSKRAIVVTSRSSANFWSLSNFEKDSCNFSFEDRAALRFQKLLLKENLISLRLTACSLLFRFSEKVKLKLTISVASLKSSWFFRNWWHSYWAFNAYVMIFWNLIAISERYLCCCFRVCRLGSRSRNSSSQVKTLLLYWKFLPRDSIEKIA